MSRLTRELGTPAEDDETSSPPEFAGPEPPTIQPANPELVNPELAGVLARLGEILLSANNPQTGVAAGGAAGRRNDP